ncbi:TetR/AcrR family transcriptional regulator [Vibrio sp. JC009]|uniref:TetR/AcrR family transcriptional regulator n=1 Tax=Vibrio sp. JC009 TaxID=2912314 RepID=UPI0023AF4CBA|nr:TetR/AcrR family transcriptional regulator [Vibrio sp. JC009]WED22888.1 TetR/AcrR family transcriptional regulator [Vibrio sp. JC009]
MRKQEARQQREQHIIQTVLDRLEISSVLDLTMSDIAKASECSMGAIYSHFPSKEDLLIAVSNETIKQDLAILEKVTEKAKDDFDKLLSTVFAIAALFVERPQYYALNQLAMNPNIWANASASRVEEGNKMAEQILENILELVDSVNKEKGLTLDDRSAELFVTSLYGMVVGVMEIKMSGYGMILDKHSDRTKGPVYNLIPAVCRLLSAWSIKDTNLAEHVEIICQTVTKDVIEILPE